jgi:hypothetical protein
VTTVWTTSTSLSTGAGLKKCRPTRREGREVATAIWVTDNDEVLVAKSVSGGHTLSRAVKISCLRSRCSGTASTTSWAPARSSSEVVYDTRLSSACCASSVSLPRETARPVDASMCERARSSPACVGSTPTTASPARAKTSVIPEPIVPRPTTPTVVKCDAAPPCGGAAASPCGIRPPLRRALPCQVCRPRGSHAQFRRPAVGRGRRGSPGRGLTLAAGPGSAGLV